jgi:penicillin V acylase-like amidase (Ntn superfamily)
LLSIQPVSQGACTWFCLDNGDHCVFGANQDNTLEIGLLFVNKRNVAKTVWDPNTSGEYARWISRYGSVTINFVGYQMAWAGMNEAGLMISTMSVAATQGPIPDERPPFQGPFWMQYQLDNHSTIDQVIASDAEIRLAVSAVDHYLVCDRTGACATLEFLEGKLVYHTGESLPVKALTNNTYQESVSAWEKSLLEESQPDDNSLWHFTTVANRLEAFEPSSSDEAVAHAFDTLAAVSREDTVWSFVYDPVNLSVYFRTKHNPSIRYLDLPKLDFSCSTPVRLLDVHADLSGDVSDELTAYTHEVSLNHSLSFFTQYEGMSLPPFLVNALVRGMESFPCVHGDVSTQPDLTLYRPLLPPPVIWGGLVLLDHLWPIWIPLVVLSLAFVIWRMAVGQPASPGRQLAWVLVTILLGPFGLLAYLMTRRKKNRMAKAA